MGPQVGPKKFLKKLHTLEICNKNRFFFQSLKTPGGFSHRSNFDLPPSSIHMDGISHLMKKKVGIVTHKELHQRSKFTTQVVCLIQEYSAQTLLHLADVMSSNITHPIYLPSNMFRINRYQRGCSNGPLVHHFKPPILHLA